MKTVEEISALAKRPGKVIYRDGDRVYKTFDASYSASAVLNESLNQARIAETGLRIPKIKEVTVQEGGCAIVMEYIGGTTLEQLMETCPEREEELSNTPQFITVTKINSPQTIPPSGWDGLRL